VSLEKSAPVPTIYPSIQIRVLVVAGVRLYREGMAASLRERKEIQVVGMAGSFDEAVTLTMALRPHVIALDVGVDSSLAIIRTIRAECPSSRVVAFALSESDQEILACAEAGVSGYVSTECSIDELVLSIECAARGELRCAPKTAAVLMQRLATLADSPPKPAAAPSLTIREREIASFIEHGLSNKQIAAKLCIEIATVKNHVHNILDKLNVATRGEAAARLRCNAIPPSHHTDILLPSGRSRSRLDIDLHPG